MSLYSKSAAKSVLCVKRSSSVLQTQKDSDLVSGYDSFTRNFIHFKDLECLPAETVLHKVHENLSLDLKDNRAKWHKTCCDKFGNLKLQRALKRKSGMQVESNVQKVACQSPSTSSSENQCFVCNKTGGELQKASTFNFDANVIKSTALLNDTLLLPKLSGGDWMQCITKAVWQCFTRKQKM